MDIANVYLWGTKVGAVAQENLHSVPIFNYDKYFLKMGVEISPIVMPLSERVYSFPTLSQASFHGLPGLLADSLPDKFGSKLIESYMAQQGRNADSLSAVERLLYVGERGMGALEYVPQKDYAKAKDNSIDINALVELASRILTNRKELHINGSENAMEQIINVGTSAGGARAKAVIAWNEKTNDIRSGQINAGSGYDYWLIKFDGVSNNKDKGKKADGKAYTRIEYAYSLMAKEAGINMEKCRLYEESGNYHFMTKRFDRNPDGSKLHMQTLAAIAHYDYNMPGAYSYEQTAQIMYKLKISQQDVEQLFKRMVFNILAKNKDDHVKNISFLMDKNGEWRLSPAYDITYAYTKGNRWLERHQMSMNGKTDDFNIEDFYACGAIFNMSKAKISKVIDSVIRALNKWNSFADEAMLPDYEKQLIKEQLFTDL